MSVSSFISKVAPMFQKYGAKYKFHIISFAIAQACLESGYGTSPAAKNLNNILGIGPHKRYSSWDACVEGYYTDTELGKMPEARDATTIDEYYSAFLDSKYCEDPNKTYYYAIISIINENNLKKYDAKGGQTVSSSSSSSSSSSTSTSRSTSADAAKIAASTNNEIAWDYLIGQRGWSKKAAAACIGCWLAKCGYKYGAKYSKVTPPYSSGKKNPYKYLDKELFPAAIEGYTKSNFPGNKVVMKNPPKSLKDYTKKYKPNGNTYDGYCGIGIGYWHYVYGAGALLKYAQTNKKSWDNILLQLDFASYYYSATEVESIDGKTYMLSANRPTVYALRQTKFSSVDAAVRWFMYYENTSWYDRGYAPQKYIDSAKKVYKEFKGREIGAMFVYTNDGTGGVVSDPDAVIDASAINALIVSIDKSVKPKDIDYKKMKSNHVSGVMFKAGTFKYNDNNVYVFSRNSNLDAQVLSAIDAGMRYGLHFDVKAKTIDEAKKECEQLYYVVSKYPPALGLWFRLKFEETNKKKNNKIMDYYVEEMSRWGLSFGCGIYCTKAELEKISWKKYKDNFYLWYTKRFKSDSDFDKLNKVLSPDFFVV